MSAHEPFKVYASSQVTRYSRILDAYRRKVSDDPTPSKMAALLSSVDAGDIASLCQLQEEMEAKDARIQAVAQTRRLALTALEWEIEPADESAKAKTAATYLTDTLNAMPSWPTTLEHLSTAIGPNVAVAEIVYDKQANPIATIDVPGHRLTAHPYFDRGVWLEVDEDYIGLHLMPGKFIVYHPNDCAGFPFRKTLTHACTVPFLMKHFSRADWMAFSELYGVPLRWTEEEAAASVGDDDRATAKEMIENMSSDAAANLPAGIQLKFLELANRSGDTFVNQMDWADTTLAILFLGQTLTTDVGDRGSFAAAKVHDNVRADLLLSDIAKEARAIREQVFRPVLEQKFPGADVLIPHFKRKLVQKRDVDSERLDLEQLRVAREFGLPLMTEEVYERLGFTQPDTVTEAIMDTQPEPEPDEKKKDDDKAGNPRKPAE